MYQLIENSDVILRLSDNAHIPNDPANSDRIRYEQWLADGNIPLPVPPKSTEQLALESRAKRDQLLDGTQWLVQRHQDQVNAGIQTTFTAEQYAALLMYRQALRDLPNQAGFPETVTWPIKPEGM